ncbi:MAG TPA: bifunctional adenosylcobinamide kinase/adenosylcobinamide-phosphate guanylyltransferase [Vicinamibacteria bacterium]
MLTLVLGGARSGKSRYSQSLAAAAGGPVLFIATASSLTPDEDPEMAARIARHQADRPAHWKTLETPLGVVDAVRSAHTRILVDCVTLWISNLLHEHRTLERASREKRIVGEVEALAAVLREKESIAVSNQVGEGIVPETPLAREFRDLQGQANQILAREASRVVLLVAGIPVTLKG